MKVATRKKVPPVEPIVEQTDEGVRVLYPGRVLREEMPAPAVTRQPVKCPYCVRAGRDGLDVKRATGQAGVSWYECSVCFDPEARGPGRFKVPSSRA